MCLLVVFPDYHLEVTVVTGGLWFGSTVSSTLRYINMDPGMIWGLEDWFPLKIAYFQGQQVNLPEGITNYLAGSCKYCCLHPFWGNICIYIIFVASKTPTFAYFCQCIVMAHTRQQVVMHYTV